MYLKTVISLFLNNFLSLLFVLTVSANVKAGTYYVDNVKGDDTNSGVQEGPWKTLDKATNRAYAGDTLVIVSNGVDYPYNEILWPRHNGQKDKWITIKGESTNNKPYITGDGTSPHLCLINDKDYINIQNIIFKDSLNNHGIMLRDCHYIKLENLEIRDVPAMSGIFARGGGNIVVSKCTLTDIGNNGIAFMGGRSEPLHNTVIEDCTISNIGSNDGVTIHKGDKGGNVGSTHLIKNNDISNCDEEGIDAASGKDIIVDGNKTSNNDAGVITSWDVENVIIKNHISKNEKRFGIVADFAKNVVVENCFIENAKVHQLVIRKCDKFEAKYNRIISGDNSTQTSVITISPDAKNLVFSNNVFLLTRDAEGPMLSYLKGATAQNINAAWDSNTWWNPNNNRKIIYERTRGHYYFDEFKELYAPNDEFKYPNTLLKPPEGLRMRPQ